MNNFFRFVIFVAGILAAASLVRAQSVVVGVRASYTSAPSNAQLILGDPVNISIGGGGDQEGSRQVEFMVDTPMLITVSAPNLASYRLAFSPPAPFGMMIAGVRRDTYDGTTTETLKITLVRREATTAQDSPLGETSSIQWYAPTAYASGPPKWPYLAFNLGAATNGEALPPLRIPLAKRTTSSNQIVLPDTTSITGYVPSNGAFQFSVPEMDVKLELVGGAGNFDVKFLAPGGTAPFAKYEFRINSWAGDAANALKNVSVTKIVAGSVENLVTRIEGYFGETGISQYGTPNNTWKIEDWHTANSSAGRVLLGTRGRTLTGNALHPTEFRIDTIYVDTVEVKPSEGSSTVASKTTSEYNNYAISDGTDTFYVLLPFKSTDGVGDGNYVTQSLISPNVENVQGSTSADGRVHLVDDYGQYARTIYETWLDASPTFNGTGTGAPVAVNGGTQTTIFFETASRFMSFQWPKSIERKLGATVLSKSLIAYAETTVEERDPGTDADDLNVVTATRTDYADPAGTVILQTVVKTYRPDAPANTDAHLRGRVYSVQSPTGAKRSYAYALGTYSGTGWSADFRMITLSGAATGGAAVTGVDGQTVDTIQLHPNKSTKTVEYLNRGRLVRREVWIYVGGGGTSPTFNSGDPVAWETFAYTTDGRLTSRTSSTGASFAATWVGTRKTNQTDETNLTTSFNYDDQDRVIEIVQSAAAGLSAQRTAIEYDAAHRITFSRVGPASGEQLVTATEYDRGGRVKKVKQPGQGSTSVAGTITTDFSYSNGGRDVQTTYASGTSEAATKSVVRFVDGRAKDVTGSAVVEEHYSYDFDASNRERMTRTLGPNQKRKAVTVVDLLGRVAEERMDGFGSTGSQKPLVTYREYYLGTGLLKKIYGIEGGSSIPITGNRLMEYDEFGQLKAAGLDLNSNNVLDPSGTDRFETFDSAFVNESGAWWKRVMGRRYHTNNSSVYNESRSDTRLTALSGMIAQSVDYDYYGNATTRTVVANASDNTRRVRTKYPDSTTEERVLVGGMVKSERWFDDTDQSLSGTPALSTGYTYDALGRTTAVADARTGSAQTTYWYGTALPREQYDARGILVGTLGYDAAGRLFSRTDPASTVNYAYTSRGELREESGSGTYSSRREYTSYGELKELKAYRSGFSGAADVTAWTFDDNTGWLVAKTDAANQMATFDYGFVTGYREVVRQSARSPGTPTTSRYDLLTGDLVKIDYTDANTPDVNFLEYNRDGSLKTVQDATGTRTLSYDHGQLTTEALPAWFNSLVLTHDYFSSTSTAANTVAGRYRRWMLGTAGDPEQELSVAYGYDNLGRVNGVTADYKAQTSRAALNVPASYQYRANSSLWESFTQGNFSTTRNFEANRDVLTSITNAHTTAGTVATHGYGTDDAGRRTWATQSGMAFGDFVDTASDATYYRYSYNALSELEGAVGYRGTNPLATTSPLPGRGFGFTYDGAGNRKTASVSGDSVSYLDAPSGSPGGNSLNQTRSRGTLKTRVSGTAEKTSTVTVGGAAVTREATPGRYWDYALPTYGQNVSVGVNATLSGQTTQTGTVQAVTRPANETLDYDLDGNLTGDSQWSYEWDAENRLLRMFTKGDAISGWGAPNRDLLFTYDYLGRRVRKISKQGGATVSDRKFIYDGWSLIAELDTATNKIVRSYAWGLDVDGSVGGTGGVGGLVLETVHSDTALTAFHVSYDGGGNVTALVNRATNQVAASYEYGPFGENVRTQVFDATLIAQGQPFRFSTKFTDSETGLVYYGHRYYDPSLGRFINRDPIGEAGGKNLYGFVGNGPVNKWDYLGLDDKTTENPPLGWVWTNMDYDSHDGDTDTSGSFADRDGRTSTNKTDSGIGAGYRRNNAITGAPNSVPYAEDGSPTGTSAARGPHEDPNPNYSGGGVVFVTTLSAKHVDMTQKIPRPLGRGNPETMPLRNSGAFIVEGVVVTVETKRSNPKSITLEVTLVKVVMTTTVYYNKDSPSYKDGQPRIQTQYAENQHAIDFWEARDSVIIPGLKEMVSGPFAGTPKDAENRIRRFVESEISKANLATVNRYDRPGPDGEPPPHNGGPNPIPAGYRGFP